jgi:hypothetical protein
MYPIKFSCDFCVVRLSRGSLEKWYIFLPLIQAPESGQVSFVKKVALAGIYPSIAPMILKIVLININ